MSIGSDIADIRKGNVAPLNVVLGTEEYLMEMIRKAFVQGVLNGEEDEFNFGRFDMETTSLGSALEEAESFPFFGDQRLIFIDHPYFFTGEKVKNGPEHDVGWLEEYLTHPSDFSVVVFFASYEKLDRRKKISKLLKKNAHIISVQPMKEKETKQYIKDYLSTEQFAIQPQAFEKLFQLTDGKLTRIMNELDKLMVYRNESRTIQAQDVKDLVPKSLDQNIFELNDKVLKRDAEGALELYSDLLLQKEEPIKIIALMISQFRLLLQVKILRKKGYQQAEIASVLKVHPYRVKLAARQERQFDQETLSRAHRGLIEADYQMKTGKVDQILQFELFILKFAEGQKKTAIK